VDFRGRPSQHARKCVSDIRLDRLLLRRPDIPAASKLQANDGTNVRAQAVQIRLQAERIGEQEALPVGIGRIHADLPIRFAENRAKRVFELVVDGDLNNLRTFASQFIQFPVAFICARDVGRVLVSGESESMAVEDDVNVFGETLDDPVGL
jgi:hypothetical protein